MNESKKARMSRIAKDGQEAVNELLSSVRTHHPALADRVTFLTNLVAHNHQMVLALTAALIKTIRPDATEEYIESRLEIVTSLGDRTVEIERGLIMLLFSETEYDTISPLLLPVLARVADISRGLMEETLPS